MAPRFTVIQGGLSEQAEPAELRTWQVLDRAAGWHVDPRRPGGEDAEAASVRPAALGRNAVVDPLRGSIQLPAQARHCPAGQSVALAWDRDAEAGCEASQDADSWVMPYRVLVRRAPSCIPAETDNAGLAAQAAAEAVDRAVKARLRALRRPIRLVGAPEPVRVSPSVRSGPAANRSTRLRTVPAMAFIGIRPVGWEAPAAQIRPLTEPAASRDPAEASPGRVVATLFGRRGAMRTEFLRRAGAVVADALRLGTGAALLSWRWARA